MIITEQLIDSLRKKLQIWRQSEESIALVPTMGNLHAGHLRLVDEAKKNADRVVASIFVNPTQFSEGEDFSSYPRTLQQDIEHLAAHQVEIVFIPDVSEMYAPPNLTVVDVSELSGQLCGEFRPGHFAGVATVVGKLFNIVQPDIAVFGEKDYQQLVLIRSMVSDLNMPIQIIGVPTVRVEDGLALSSRNQYLTAEQRTLAPLLYATLSGVREQLLTNVNREYSQLEKQQTILLEKAGFKLDYFAIRNADDLSDPNNARHQQLVILVAARLGKTRLIDNLLV